MINRNLWIRHENPLAQQMPRCKSIRDRTSQSEIIFLGRMLRSYHVSKFSQWPESWVGGDVIYLEWRNRSIWQFDEPQSDLIFEFLSVAAFYLTPILRGCCTPVKPTCREGAIQSHESRAQMQIENASRAQCQIRLKIKVTLPTEIDKDWQKNRDCGGCGFPSATTSIHVLLVVKPRNSCQCANIYLVPIAFSW